MRMKYVCRSLFVLCMAIAGVALADVRATTPVPRDDGDVTWWFDRMRTKKSEIAAAKGSFDVVMLGDSITHGWEGRGQTAYAELLKDRKILNLGYSGDCTEHLLWRITKGGELDGYKTRFFTLLIGTNNRSDSAEDVAGAIRRIIELVRDRHPESRVVLMPIFPRGEKDEPLRTKNARTAELIRPLADGASVIWLDLTADLVDADGGTDDNFKDHLHLNEAGFRIWLSKLENALPVEKDRVLFLTAHPDDIISSLGTCLLMRDRFEIHVVDFTHGERGLGEAGFRDGSTKAKRIAEESEVMLALGAKLHWLDELDGDSWVTRETVAKLAEILREVKPRAIFGHWPIDMHMDHMMSAAALQKAARTVGFTGEFYFFEESFDSKGFQDVFYVDITPVAKEKERLIRLYACQNQDDEMCRMEMRNSSIRAERLWPSKVRGYAEAFAPYGGRPQGPNIFAEIPFQGERGKLPKWGL